MASYPYTLVSQSDSEIGVAVIVDALGARVEVSVAKLHNRRELFSFEVPSQRSVVSVALPVGTAQGAQ